MGVLPDHGGEDANSPLPRWVKSAARFADDPLTTARSLRPLIERNASESERLGRLSDEAVQALCGSGLLGLLIPRELGGIEADPGLYIDVIEELSVRRWFFWLGNDGHHLHDHGGGGVARTDRCRCDVRQ